MERAIDESFVTDLPLEDRRLARHNDPSKTGTAYVAAKYTVHARSLVQVHELFHHRS
jgi:hypothetical protein